MGSKRRQRLTRSVLSGLALATLLSGSLVSTSYAATADTVSQNRTDTQNQINRTPADQRVTVGDGQPSYQDLSSLENSQPPKQVVESSGGTVALRANDVSATNHVHDIVVQQGTSSGGRVYVYHGSQEDAQKALEQESKNAAMPTTNEQVNPVSDSVAPSIANGSGTTDLSNTKLVLNENGDIFVTNGTVVEKADNILKDVPLDGASSSSSSYSDSKLHVGLPQNVYHSDWKNPSTTLKLTGDSYGGLQDSDGKVIQVNPSGTLEANSGLVFSKQELSSQGVVKQSGLDKQGMETIPGNLNKHVDLEDGSTVKLDDPLYNDEYLENARFGLQNGMAGNHWDSSTSSSVNNSVNLAAIGDGQIDTMRTIGGVVDGAGNLHADTAHVTTNAQNTADVNFKDDFAGNKDLRTVRVVNGATANINLQHGDVYRNGIYDDANKGVLQAGRDAYSYGGFTLPPEWGGGTYGATKAPKGEGESTGTINLQFANPDGAVANLTNIDLKTNAIPQRDKDGNPTYEKNADGTPNDSKPLKTYSNINIVNGTVESMTGRLQGSGNINVGSNTQGAPAATLRFLDDNNRSGSFSGNLNVNASGTLEAKSGTVFYTGLDNGDGMGRQTNPGDNSNSSNLNPIAYDKANFENGSHIVLDDAFYNDEYLENAQHAMGFAYDEQGGFAKDNNGNRITKNVTVSMNPNAIDIEHTVRNGTEDFNFNTLADMNSGHLQYLRAGQGGIANVHLQNGDVFRDGTLKNGLMLQAGRGLFYNDTTGGEVGTMNLQFANDGDSANLRNVYLVPKTFPTYNADRSITRYNDSNINLVNGTVRTGFRNVSPLQGSESFDADGNVTHRDENHGIINVQRATLDFSGFTPYSASATRYANGSFSQTSYRPGGVKVSPQGKIQANSFQLFDQGVGGLATNANPGNVNPDADGLTQEQRDALTAQRRQDIQNKLGGFEFQRDANGQSQLLLNDPFTAGDAANQYLQVVQDALGSNVNVQWAHPDVAAPTVTDISTVPTTSAQPVGALQLGDNPNAIANYTQGLTAQMLGANLRVTPTVTVNNSNLTLGTNHSNVELFTNSNNNWLPVSGASLNVANNSSLTLNTGDSDSTNHFTGTIALQDETTSTDANASQTHNTLNLMGGKVLVDAVTAGRNALVNVGRDAQAQINRLTLNNNAQFNVQGATYDGSLFDGNPSITANDNSVINITDGGTIRNVDINGNGSGRVNVGNDEGAGHLVADDNISGVNIFLDPTWQNGTENESSTFINSGTNVVYTLTVGQNSEAALGSTETAAQRAFSDAALAFGPTNRTALLYADAPISVQSSRGIDVDGSLNHDTMKGLTPRTNRVDFTAGSALLVNGNNPNFYNNSSAVITGQAPTDTTEGTTISVSPDSKLAFTGKIAATANGTTPMNVPYTFQLANNVTPDTDTQNSSNWYMNPSRNTGIVAPWNFDVTRVLNPDGTVRHGAVTLTRRNWSALNGAMRNLTNAAWDNMPANSNTETITGPGTSVYNPATAAMFGPYGSMQGWRSEEEAAALTNTLSMPTETTGATYMATQATHALTDAAQNRYSFLTEDMATDDGGIWLKYGHSNDNVDGLNMSGLNGKFDGSFNTISLGFDFGKKEDFSQGVALGYAKGSSNGRFEHNDFHVGGLSYYGAANHDKNNFLFDVGYYQAKSDVDGFVDANPDTDLFSLGVKDEYRYDAGEDSYFVPYIGLRWTRVNTDSYTSSFNGGDAFRYNPSTENLFTLPLGVSYLKETQAKGWDYKFKVNLGYVAALGGRSADMGVSAIGIPNANGMASYDIADQSTLLAGLGINASNDKMSWGLGYQYHHSSDSHGHNITANISWSF